jgi:hypothetical protein
MSSSIKKNKKNRVTAKLKQPVQSERCTLIFLLSVVFFLNIVTLLYRNKFFNALLEGHTPKKYCE